MANGWNYVCISTTLEVKIYLDKSSSYHLSSNTSNWVCYTKTEDQRVEILIIWDSDPWPGTQKYVQFNAYSPNWGRAMPILAEVARDVVTQFPELKLSRTLWASGEQRPKTKANLGCWKCTTRASRGFNGFSQPGNWMPSIRTPHTHSLYKSLLVRLL